MSATDLSTDVLGALDFHEARSCEHSEHFTDPAYHVDGDEQFVRVFYPCGCKETRVRVYCGQFLLLVLYRPLVDEVFLFCELCGNDRPASEVLNPLGPANERNPT